jgi:hypothetical protein
VGRDGPRARLVAALAGAEPGPVAVLGGPGIGKSTLVVAALHDAAVAERFGARRWFVRCDGAASGDALLAAVATELGVVTDAGGDLRQRVRQALGDGRALLVLDNLETPWYSDTVGTEDVLRDLAGIAGVALATTIRGVGWPAGVDWREQIVVSALNADETRQVFVAIAGRSFADDPDLPSLLGQMDGVPLAVELLACNAQGHPDLSELAARWGVEKAAVLARGAADRRELSVPVSVELSVGGPAMTPEGRRLLSVLGLLPAGIARDGVAAVLPGAGLAGAAVLRRTGLAFDEAGRLRLLAPVREHVAAEHPPADTDRARVVSHYCRVAASLGAQVGRAGGGQAAARLAAEVANLQVTLTSAVERAATGGLDEVVEAAVGLAEFQRLTGVTIPGLLDAVAAAVPDEHRASRARVLAALGGAALGGSDHDAAERSYRSALLFYEQDGDATGQADCIQGLGHVALARGRYDEARAAYQRASSLFERAGSVPGQATCIMSLGDIAFGGSDQTGAQDAYERALADEADRARHLDAARRLGGGAGESGGVASGVDDGEAPPEDYGTRRRWRRRR